MCVLAVPNHMTYADFCRFCGAFVPHTLEMRIVRCLASPDRYCYALLTLHTVAYQSVELMQSDHLSSLNRWFELICSLSSLNAVSSFYNT